MVVNNMINEKFNIENKNIVLTGSSGRLGKQYAHFLSSGGANMILLEAVNVRPILEAVNERIATLMFISS